MEFIGNDTQKIEQLLHMVCLDSHPLIQNISIGNIIEIAFQNDAKKEKRLKHISSIGTPLLKALKAALNKPENEKSIPLTL